MSFATSVSALQWHFSGTSVALPFHLVMQAGEFRREKEAVEQQTNELNKRLRNLKVSTCKVIGKETQRTGSTGCLLRNLY